MSDTVYNLTIHYHSQHEKYYNTSILRSSISGITLLLCCQKLYNNYPYIPEKDEERKKSICVKSCLLSLNSRKDLLRIIIYINTIYMSTMMLYTSKIINT